MCNGELDNRLSEFLKKIEVTKQQQKEQITQELRKETFNKEFWDYTFVIIGKTAQTIANKLSNNFYGYFIKEDNTGYHVGCRLPKTGYLFHDEYDRCSDAIELYSIVYEEVEPDKKNNDSKKNTICFKFQNNNRIKVSGDIDFNFKMKHVRYFIDIIDNGKSEMTEAQKTNLKNILISFMNLTYHPANISLLPITGALNNIKKALGNDRLDTFLFALKLYYEKEITSFVLSGAGGPNPPYIGNRNKLREFLDSFNCGSNNSESIYNYCKKMYHIEKELVDDLCSSGLKTIDTPERVDEYLKLATRFWAQKNEFYRDSNNDIKSQYQKMVKIITEARGLEYNNTFTGTKEWKCQ